MFALVYGLFGGDAAQYVVDAMFIIPAVVFVICVPLAVWRVFVPKRTSHEKWLAREAAKPWPDPTPWRAKNPIDLTPYATQARRIARCSHAHLEPHF
jgi:hypothetical protein